MARNPRYPRVFGSSAAKALSRAAFVATGGAGPQPSISFSVASATVPEGNSGTTAVPNTINVTRNGVTGALVVNLSTGGSATAGTDYTALPGTVTIPDGQNSVVFDLSVGGDTAVEPDENVIIYAQLAAYPSATASKTVTIANDDVAAVAPTIVSAPTFTGTPQAGQTAVGQHGAYNNSPTSYANQWQSSADGGTTWANISGATSLSFLYTSAEVGKIVRLVEIASNATGSSPSNPSAASGTVAAAGAGLASDIILLGAGDSHIVGVGAGENGSAVTNARPKSMLMQAMNRLNARGIRSVGDTIAADNNNGITHAEWHDYRPEIIVTGTFAAGSLVTTAGGVAFRQGAGTSISIDTVYPVDRVRIGFPRNTGFGVININDGTNNYTVLENDGGPDYVTAVVALTSGKSIKRLTFSAASGTIHGPFYVDAYASDQPSIRMINAGARNWKSSDWVVADNPSRPLNAIAGIAPHIGLIELLTNDARQAGTTMAQAQANMQAMITKMKLSASIIILVVPPPINAYSTATDNWSQAGVKQIFDALIAANPTATLIDSPKLMFEAGFSGATNPATYAAANALGHYFDTLHFKEEVHQLIGYAIADMIIARLGL